MAEKSGHGDSDVIFQQSLIASRTGDGFATVRKKQELQKTVSEAAKVRGTTNDRILVELI